MAPLLFINSLGQPVLASGGSGGEKIVPALISTTWRALYRDSDIKTAIDYPRFMPEFDSSTHLLYEYGLPEFLLNELRRRGHVTVRQDNSTLLDSYIANVNAVCRTKTGSILGNSDYRKEGDSAGF
jgi:gamma-glutamyltranspeptidase